MHPTIEVQQQSELAQRRLVEAAERQVEEVQETLVGGRECCSWRWPGGNFTPKVQQLDMFYC